MQNGVAALRLLGTIRVWCFTYNPSIITSSFPGPFFKPFTPERHAYLQGVLVGYCSLAGTKSLEPLNIAQSRYLSTAARARLDCLLSRKSICEL
jgi:hypothetical protein